MAAGDADAFIAAYLSNDPDGHTTLGGLATDFGKNHAFLRGFRNCVEGIGFSSGWSDEREQGYRAAQSLGLFDVWP